MRLHRTYRASSGQHFYTTSVSDYNQDISNGSVGYGICAHVLP